MLLFVAQALTVEPFGVFRRAPARLRLMLSAALLPGDRFVLPLQLLLARGSGQTLLLTDALIFRAARALIGRLGLLVIRQRRLRLPGRFSIELSVVDLHVIRRHRLFCRCRRLFRFLLRDHFIGLPKQGFDVFQQGINRIRLLRRLCSVLRKLSLIAVFHTMSPSIFRPTGPAGGKKVSNSI